MTVSVLFELRDTDPDSPLSQSLREVEAMPWNDRDYIIGAVMMQQGQRMMEKAAIWADRERVEKDRAARAAETRRRNREKAT